MISFFRRSKPTPSPEIADRLRAQAEADNARYQRATHQWWSDTILGELDDDLAAPWRGLSWECRPDQELVKVQTMRLFRRLLEKLDDCDKRGEARGNG